MPSDIEISAYSIWTVLQKIRAAAQSIGSAGELAAEHSRTEGPGTFRVSLLDSFDKLGPQYMEAKMRVMAEM